MRCIRARNTGLMGVFAFVFLGGGPTPTKPRPIDTDTTRLVRTLIAHAAGHPSAKIAIRSGGVWVDEQAWQRAEVRWVSPTAVQHSAAINPHAWLYIVAEFAEARREAWHRGDLQAIDTALSHHGLDGYAVSSIDVVTAELLHHILLESTHYLGAIEVDMGHPIMRDLLWSYLIPAYELIGTKLGFVDLLPSEEDRESLDESGWWRDVGATNLYWTTDSDDAYQHPDPIDIPPASLRGHRAFTNLQRIMAPTVRERILDEFAVNPAKLPADTGAFCARPFPGSDFVVVPEAKLRHYALDLQHDTGKHKARLFRDLLGIYADDWQYLAEQLRRGVRQAPALREVRSDQYGVRFDVVTAVQGRNGAIKPVLSGWIVKPGMPATLTTTLPAARGTCADAGPDAVPILPSTDFGDWSLLWRVASAAADQAADLVVPYPIIAVDGNQRQYVLAGATGLADVRIRDASHGFGQWLLTTGRASSCGESAAEISAPVEGCDAAAAWAQTFADVVGWHGIRCAVRTSAR